MMIWHMTVAMTQRKRHLRRKLEAVLWTSENGIEEVQETDRKLIRNVNLSLQTKEFDTVLDNMSQKIKDLGGYIQDSSVWGSSSDYSSSRSASYTLRIPSDKLDEFIDVVETLGNVTYKK